MDTVIVRKASYDYEMLKPTISDMLEAVGTLEIQHGSFVLVKPNFLAPAKPELAVATHPLVMRAVNAGSTARPKRYRPTRKRSESFK